MLMLKIDNNFYYKSKLSNVKKYANDKFYCELNLYSFIASLII